ncbi:hypothetical protein BDV95DRAFT_508970 [Massariosphaeria phaeospora]|uniref:ZZ-type domain-containing protein n=1 Tax=Massariosphaeria phaeospora TaxID=100035 RepID=A0A7C8M0Z5_9PLEO|nr:hypothetical protein BDV95DRAFT_508970 [Massariosphaeria phaeospora]
MSSPNPNQQYQYSAYLGQSYHATPPYPDDRYPKPHNQSNPHLAYYSGYSTDYAQPQYGTAAPIPIIAELPAPLPPAPATSTPNDQLNHDQLLAHKLQQTELEEVRSRSNSLSLHRPHSTFELSAPASPQPRQGSMSVSSSSVVPFGPDSFGQPPDVNPNSPLAPQLPFTRQTTARLPPAPRDPPSLSAYLEYHRQVPYPPQWVLPPVQATFYGYFHHTSKSDWLDVPESQMWRTVRYSENARNPTLPTFKLGFKTAGGTFRDPRFSWTMSFPTTGKKKKLQSPPWNYNLRLDKDTNMRKTETLQPPKGPELLTTYVRASNYDSLKFVGPDGHNYMWVTHAPTSSINGARYDTLRHALFVSTVPNQNPLFGQIVADHAYWDGFIDTRELHPGTNCAGCKTTPITGLRWKCRVCTDHEVCEPCRLSNTSIKPECSFTLVSLPDEALHIRSPTVDTALVVATLQILKDWEMHSLREQRKKDPKGFERSVELARWGDLGRVRYWRYTDFEGKGGGEQHGTMVKAREGIKMAGEVTVALGETAAALAGGDHGGGTGGSGGDGGGGGGGM